MTNFYFSDEDSEALYAYLENPPIEEVAVLAVNEIVAEEGMKDSTKMMIFALILLLLVFILTSVKNSLKESLGQKNSHSFWNINYAKKLILFKYY